MVVPPDHKLHEAIQVSPLILADDIRRQKVSININHMFLKPDGKIDLYLDIVSLVSIFIALLSLYIILSLYARSLERRDCLIIIYIQFWIMHENVRNLMFLTLPKLKLLTKKFRDAVLRR